MPQWFDHSIQENLLKDKSPSTEALQWNGEVCLVRDMHNSCYQGLIRIYLCFLSEDQAFKLPLKV